MHSSMSYNNQNKKCIYFSSRFKPIFYGTHPKSSISINVMTNVRFGLTVLFLLYLQHTQILKQLMAIVRSDISR